MSQRGERLGYEFISESAAKELAAELDRRFDRDKLTGLRVYRIVWNQNFLIEATFSKEAAEADRAAARALLGEAGTPVHPNDLEDYKRARPGMSGGWFRRLFRG